MTKQEQIEEMAVIGCVRNPQAHTAEECSKCDFKQGCCNAYRHAEALYNAGYREADEVRKETAKEILNMLYDMGIDKEILECCRIYDVDGVSLAKQICEKYDVEVEE